VRVDRERSPPPNVGFLSDDDQIVRIADSALLSSKLIKNFTVARARPQHHA